MDADPPPLLEHLWCAGDLYAVFADLSDIVDGDPFDYGPATEMITQREIRDAAWEWLDGPCTADKLESYMDRWQTRIAALPATYAGQQVRSEPNP